MALYTYDVIVVGASLAGCTAAILYGRAGLKVALIERQPENDAYKKLCTHYIQASAKPVLDRLGLSERIESAGGIRNSMAIWTKAGWIKPSATHHFPAYGYSLRREKLDPLIRQLVGDTAGVDLFLGQAVRALVRDGDGRVSGIVSSEQKSRQNHQFRGRLIVAADGHYSKVAELAGVKGRQWQNGRFGYFAYYRHLPLQTGNAAQIWFRQPDVAYAFPNEEGITLIAYMPTHEKLPLFKPDPLTALEQHFATLPDGPDMQKAERISPVLGMLKGEFHLRSAAAPGLALVGDAAASTDPLWGCGCGWAFESSAWLVEATASALRENGNVDKCLGRYKRHHYRQLAGHNWYNGGFASGRNFYPHEQVVLRAAAKDEQCARHIHAFAARHIGVAQLHSPRNFLRALWINWWK